MVQVSFGWSVLASLAFVRGDDGGGGGTCQSVTL